MRILVCGDLHCKVNLLEAALKCTEWDYFVFLGDACDNWGATQEDNIRIIERLIELKDEYGERFIWIIGNHDWGYYDTSYRMSGHIHEGSASIYYLLKDHIKDWQISHHIGRFLFSHAGLSERWLDEVASPLANESFAHKPFGTIIEELKYKPGLNNPLNNIGLLSNGFSDNPSPLWMRPDEGVLPPQMHRIQIVGHTPVRRIEQSETGFICCDTLSQDSSKMFYGDLTVLLIDYNIATPATIASTRVGVDYKMVALDITDGKEKYNVTNTPRN